MKEKMVLSAQIEGLENAILIITNGRFLEKRNVSSVKIPNAFADMERLMNHR